MPFPREPITTRARDGDWRRDPSCTLGVGGFPGPRRCLCILDQREIVVDLTKLGTCSTRLRYQDDIETAIKVLIIGNGAVGKSSMIQRICKGTYTESYKKTIGVDFLEKTMT